MPLFLDYSPFSMPIIIIQGFGLLMVSSIFCMFPSCIFFSFSLLSFSRSSALSLSPYLYLLLGSFYSSDFPLSFLNGMPRFSIPYLFQLSSLQCSYLFIELSF